MGLSPNMILWVEARVREAQEILANPRSTPSQKSVARHVLATWEVR